MFDFLNNQNRTTSIFYIYLYFMNQLFIFIFLEMYSMWIGSCIIATTIIEQGEI